MLKFYITLNGYNVWNANYDVHARLGVINERQIRVPSEE